MEGNELDDGAQRQPEGPEQPASASTPTPPGQRLVVAGTAVVGIWSLTSLDSSSTDTAAIALLASVLAGVVLLMGRSRPPVSTAAILLITSAVVAVLSLLDLLDASSNLDTLDENGGIGGLIGFFFYFIGGVLMLWGAVQMWRPVRPVAAVEESGLAERLALVGGLVVVGAWVFMMLAPGWVLLLDQAIGVAAATTASVLVLLHRTGASLFSLRGKGLALIVLTALALIMAVNSLINFIPALDFIVEFGGPQMYVPYVAYLMGGALLGAAAVVSVIAMRDVSGRTGPVVAVIAALFGLVLLSLGRGDGPVPTTANTPSTTQLAAPAPVASEGPQIAPVDGCSLLTEFEVYDALGVGYEAEAILDESGTGPSRNGADGGSVREACTWSHYRTLDAWVQDETDFRVRVMPGDPADFEPGATFEWESGEATSVAVPGVGDLAVWFPDDNASLISVIRETPFGHVFVRIAVHQPDLGDAARLDIAKGLTERVIERLQTGPVGPVEVELCDLVTDEEAEEVLAPYREGRPAALDELFIRTSRSVDLTQPGDSSCTKLILAEIYVEVAQGAPTGFEEDSELGGVVGEPVPAVGDQAIWFPGVLVDDFAGARETGVLNVRQGHTYFRIVLSLPDAPPDEQLEIAKRMAFQALSRLSGDGVTVTRESRQVDPGPVDLVDNLLVREEAGEWTRGEGLVATLRLFAGEVDVVEVLGSFQPVDALESELIILAEDYVVTGPDETARVEIARLLDLLLVTRDQLEEISEPESPAGKARGLLVNLGSLLAQTEEAQQDYCSEVFQTSSPCLVEETTTELEAKWPGKYAFFRPKGELNSGWDVRHIDATREAMLKSATLFESLGTMPPVAILLTQYEHWRTLAEPECVINVPTHMQTVDEGLFKQALAFRMAACLLHHTFPVGGIDEALVGRWWFKATAIYLSGVVYDKVNGEHVNAKALEAEELDRGLLSRVDTNWIFFEHLHPKMSPSGIMSLIGGLPGTLHTDITARWHPFNEELTDARVPDIGGGVVPFRPHKQDVEIHGPGEASFDVSSFGVNRLAVEVVGGRIACVEYGFNNQVSSSWRPGSVGSPGGGWTDLPETLQGRSVFLLTAVSTAETGLQPDATLTIRVKKMVDLDGECEREEVEEISPPPPPPDCPLDPVCISTSDYYRFLEQLADWLRRLLDRVED